MEYVRREFMSILGGLGPEAELLNTAVIENGYDLGKQLDGVDCMWSSETCHTCDNTYKYTDVSNKKAYDVIKTFNLSNGDTIQFPVPDANGNIVGHNLIVIKDRYVGGADKTLYTYENGAVTSRKLDGTWVA